MLPNKRNVVPLFPKEQHTKTTTKSQKTTAKVVSGLTIPDELIELELPIAATVIQGENYSITLTTEFPDIVTPCCEDAYFSIITQSATGGVLEIADATTGHIVFTPDVDFEGEFCFAVKLNCNQSDQEGYVVICVTVGACSCETVTLTTENAHITADLSDCNPFEDDPCCEAKYAITDGPLHGTASIDEEKAEFEYTANNGFVGTDEVEITITCGNKHCTRRVIITTGICDEFTVDFQPSCATPSSVQELPENTDELCVNPVYTIGTQPAHGTVTIDNEASTYTYTPTANYTGTDTFTIIKTCCDGRVCSYSVTYDVGHCGDDVAIISEYSTTTETITGLLDNPFTIAENAVFTIGAITGATTGVTATIDVDGNYSILLPANFVGDVAIAYTVANTVGDLRTCYGSINIRVRNCAVGTILFGEECLPTNTVCLDDTQYQVTLGECVDGVFAPIMTTGTTPQETTICLPYGSQAVNPPAGWTQPYGPTFPIWLPPCDPIFGCGTGLTCGGNGQCYLLWDESTPAPTGTTVIGCTLLATGCTLTIEKTSEVASNGGQTIVRTYLVGGTSSLSLTTIQGTDTFLGIVKNCIVSAVFLNGVLTITSTSTGTTPIGSTPWSVTAQKTINCYGVITPNGVTIFGGCPPNTTNINGICFPNNNGEPCPDGWINFGPVCIPSGDTSCEDLAVYGIICYGDTVIVEWDCTLTAPEGFYVFDVNNGINCYLIPLPVNGECPEGYAAVTTNSQTLCFPTCVEGETVSFGFSCVNGVLMPACNLTESVVKLVDSNGDDYCTFPVSIQTSSAPVSIPDAAALLLYVTQLYPLPDYYVTQDTDCEFSIIKTENAPIPTNLQQALSLHYYDNVVLNNGDITNALLTGFTIQSTLNTTGTTGINSVTAKASVFDSGGIVVYNNIPITLGMPISLGAVLPDGEYYVLVSVTNSHGNGLFFNKKILVQGSTIKGENYNASLTLSGGNLDYQYITHQLLIGVSTTSDPALTKEEYWYDIVTEGAHTPLVGELIPMGAVGSKLVKIEWWDNALPKPTNLSYKTSNVILS